MNPMTPNKRAARDLELFMQAMIQLRAGNREMAQHAIGVGMLSDEQLESGCLDRLRLAYDHFRSYGHKHKIRQSIILSAYSVLTQNGINACPPKK